MGIKNERKTLGKVANGHVKQSGKRLITKGFFRLAPESAVWEAEDLTLSPPSTAIFNSNPK
jgi:hypothetical protein